MTLLPWFLLISTWLAVVLFIKAPGGPFEAQIILSDADFGRLASGQTLEYHQGPILRETIVKITADSRGEHGKAT